MTRFLTLLLFAALLPLLQAQGVPSKDVYSTSNCMGCHGQTAMGGLGPPIAKTKVALPEFMKMVRQGKGMMPATTAASLSDGDVESMYAQLQRFPYLEDQIPVAFKVSQTLTTKSVSRIFLALFGFAALAALWRLRAWFRCSGIVPLLPSVRKFGFARSLAVVGKSLIFDGLLVQSLWKASRFRWLMHGLMLYGFLGLIVADVLISIYNPSRGDLALLHPLKLLPMVSGGLLFLGILYVMYRYRADRYIDNGLTLGADFLFVNLLFHTALSGFLTVTVNRLGISAWVLPVYLYHLVSLGLLVVTAPFSRFQHAWVVPLMAAFTRLTEAVSASGVEIGFEREPSPGRHHKTERIASSVLSSLGPEYSDEEFRIRYYP